MADKYVVTKDIVIPAGTVLGPAPNKVSRAVPFSEATIGFGKDIAASFTLPTDELVETGYIVPLRG